MNSNEATMWAEFSELLEEAIDKEITLQITLHTSMISVLPYTVEISDEIPFLPILNWCEEHFKNNPSPWDSYNPDGVWSFIDRLSSSTGTTWYFKNEKDAVLFSLRWL